MNCNLKWECYKMNELEDRRYKISEVSDIVDVPEHLLRQWESRFPQLKPKRNRANRRYYSLADIEIVRRIKQLLRHEKLTTEGAIKRLSQELHGVGKPLTRQDVLDLVDKIDEEARTMLHMIDTD